MSSASDRERSVDEAVVEQREFSPASSPVQRCRSHALASRLEAVGANQEELTPVETAEFGSRCSSTDAEDCRDQDGFAGQLQAVFRATSLSSRRLT